MKVQKMFRWIVSFSCRFDCKCWHKKIFTKYVKTHIRLGAMFRLSQAITIFVYHVERYGMRTFYSVFMLDLKRYLDNKTPCYCFHTLCEPQRLFEFVSVYCFINRCAVAWTSALCIMCVHKQKTVNCRKWISDRQIFAHFVNEVSLRCCETETETKAESHSCVDIWI